MERMISRSAMASSLILSTLLFMACSEGESGSEAENLLSVSRKGNEAMDRDRLNASLADMTRAANTSEDLQVLLPKLLGNASSQNSLVSVSRVNDQRDAYVAVLVFDAIADDDSVSGYRYDLHIDREAQGRWRITEAKRSWRCWKDRGHRYFSIEPCS